MNLKKDKTEKTKYTVWCLGEKFHPSPGAGKEEFLRKGVKVIEEGFRKIKIKNSTLKNEHILKLLLMNAVTDLLFLENNYQITKTEYENIVAVMSRIEK